MRVGLLGNTQILRVQLEVAACAQLARRQQSLLVLQNFEAQKALAVGIQH